jgi:hypothetical protein
MDTHTSKRMRGKIVKKLSKWLSLPVAGLYLLAPLMSYLNGEYEGMSLFEVIREFMKMLIVVGIALAFIWYEFKAGSKLLVLIDVIKLNPFGFSSVMSEIGEGTVRFLNVIFHLVGWIILLVPLIAILIYKP